jgi:hypothetical protein
LRETRRGPFGRRLEQLVEVSEYEPGRAFGLHILDGPLEIDGAYRFEARDGGTHVEFRGGGELPGPLKFVRPLVASTMRRQFAGYHRRLKKLLEAQPEAPPATSASASGVRT